MTAKDLYGYKKDSVLEIPLASSTSLSAQVLNYTKAQEEILSNRLPFHKVRIKVENFGLVVVTTLYFVE